MSLRLIPLRNQDLDTACQLVVEAREWSSRSDLFISPYAVLEAPNSFWLSVLADDEFVGILGYVGISWPDGTAELAIGVVPKWRGSGIAKEMALVQNAYGFGTLGLRRLQTIILKGAPTAKIAVASGLTLEGTLKGARLKNGSYHDAEIYAIIKGGAS